MQLSPPKWLSKVLPPNTVHTTVPPGRLQPSANPALPLVIVASFPRSGTHLLLDLILNNFAPYRRAPLYVNLDEYIAHGLCVDELIKTGGYLVKTHYPEARFSSSNHAAYEQVFAKAVIFVPTREDEAVLRSYQIMCDSRLRECMIADVSKFSKFWENKVDATYQFEDLIDTSKTLSIVSDLEKHIGIPRNSELVLPPDKSRRLQVYLRKFATRLFGNQLKIVNTTVGFDRQWRQEAKEKASVCEPSALTAPVNGKV